MFAPRLFGGRMAPALASRVSNANQTCMDSQVRYVQSMKIVKQRMRSVGNLQKITKAMKMVAAAKVKQEQRRMENGMPFVRPVQNLFERLPREEKAGAITFLAVTSDKGLCGGVNSAVAKLTRLNTADEEAKGNTAKIAILGGKGVAALKRLFSDRFTNSFEDVSKAPWNFAAASIIADRVAASNPARLKLVSNKFRSMVAYDTTLSGIVTLKEAQTMDRAEWSKAMDVYSFEPALYEVWDDLHEFYYGCAVFGANLEAATCEQSARMGAMENASKNANEMFAKLELIYNRARQAKITTELCEIISGASAV